MQVVYVNPSKLQAKLSQMGTRIETNKYQMVPYRIDVVNWGKKWSDW